MNIKGNLFLKAKKVVIDNKHKCYNCGSKFTPARGSIKRGWGMFCSRSCASKWASKEKSTDNNSVEMFPANLNKKVQYKEYKD